MATHLDGDAAEFSLRDLMAVFRRRRWMMLQAFLFVTALGVVFNAVTPPVYSTAAKLLVVTPSPAVAPIDLGAMSGVAVSSPQSTVETQLTILRSAEFARRRLLATEDPDLFEPRPEDFADPQEYANRRATYERQREEYRSHPVVAEFRRHRGARVELTYSAVPDTNVIEIVAESRDPKAAAAWANKAAFEYERLTNRFTREAIRTTREYLNEEVRKASAALAEADRQLAALKRATGSVDSAEEQAQRLRLATDLEAQRRETERELVGVTTRIRHLEERLRREPEVVVESQFVPNPEVEALAALITRKHAERAELIERGYHETSQTIREIDQAIAGLEQRRSALPATVREDRPRVNPNREQLRQQLAELRTQRETLELVRTELRRSGLPVVAAAGSPVDQATLAQLQRQRDMAEKSFLDYVDKLRDLNVRERAMQTSVSIVEHAQVPTAPVRPNKAENLLMATTLGLLVAVSFAFVQEFLDDRVKSAEELAQVTGLPTLGAVPMVRAGESCVLTEHDIHSPLIESYRTLRTAIHFMGVESPLRTLVVTSCNPGEGKTITSVNLAITMSLQGRRVVLVDADLRRPSIHYLLEVPGQPGLAELLTGDAQLAEVLHTTRVTGLQVIPAGVTPANPVELLNSEAMTRVIASLLDHADVVVFDSPAALPVSDAHVLASKVDGVLLVVEAEAARKGAIRQAQEFLQRSRARLIGTVLNKVTSGRSGYAYYSAGNGAAGVGRRGFPAGAPASRPAGGNGGAPAVARGQATGSKGGTLVERLRDWE